MALFSGWSSSTTPSASQGIPSDGAGLRKSDAETSASRTDTGVGLQPKKPDYPAIYHVAVLAGLLLPIVLAPCLFVRRSTVALHRRLDALEHQVSVMQRATALEAEAQRETVRATLDSAQAVAVEEVSGLRGEFERARKEGEERDAELRRMVEGIEGEQAGLREKLSSRFLNMFGRKPSSEA